MSEFIQQLASQLGIGTEQAETATGTVLGAIQDKIPGQDFDALLKAVPGGSGWLQAAARAGGSGAAPGSGAGGLLGAAAGMLGNLGGVGKGAAELGGLVSLLDKIGIDAGTAAKLVPMVLSFLKSQAGDSLFQRVASSVPFVGAALETGEPAGVAGALGKLF